MLAGCGGDRSPYDEGYDQGVSVSGVSEEELPPATGDRCLDLSLRWWAIEQSENGNPTRTEQDEFRRGCRAGIEDGKS